MRRCSIQPVTNGIRVELQDTAGRSERISFRQSAHRRLKNHRITFQFVVRSCVIQGNTAPTTLTKGLRLTVSAAIF